MQNIIKKVCLAATVALVANLWSMGAPAIEGVVRVKLQPEVAATLSTRLDNGRITLDNAHRHGTGASELDRSLESIKGVSIRKVFTTPVGREAEHHKYGLDLWYEITFDKSVAPKEARRIMAATAGVQHASTRVPMSLFDEATRYRTVDASAPAKAPSTSMPFNDPRLPDQWHYDNRASIGGAVAGADINLFEAWKTETGKRKVVVAIIDGGIDITHEDLADAMWTNDAELNGTPGVDDDGNGFIDDIYGFNFCTSNGTIYPHNHGTHVAGTVGAINNNGKGVAGVAGGDGSAGSGVRLMSCQVFDPRSSAGEGDFAAALIYAADMGATIASCSWGWEADGYYEQDVLDAVRYFTHTARSNNMTGGLCVFATGNSGSYGLHYPAAMDEALSVASMCADFLPATYSNYGEWVDVTAPGGDITFNQQLGVLSTLPNNTYGYSEGTSMATPHVSGIAALVLSKYGSPNMINENLRRQIVTSVNDFYAINPNVKGLFGSGYVDAAKALQWGDGTAPERVTDLKVQPSQDSALLSWTIPASSTGNVDSHVIYYSKEPFTAANTTGCSTAIVDTKFINSGERFEYEVGGLDAMTTYHFALVAMDRWGNGSEMSDVVTATTNAGPKMTINRTSMTIQSSDGTHWNTSNFVIGNTDDGLLKWEADLRTVSSAIAAFSNSPTPLATVPYTGHLAVQPYTTSAQPVADIEEFIQEDFPQSITYAEQLYSYIGDLDQTLPNSLAQLFVVDPEQYPDGFNLSHVRLEGTYGKGPLIEVYRNAGTLSASTLLTSTQLDENYITYFYDHPLTESIWFAPGESFYIVAHFEKFESRNYPLGLAIGNGSNTASQAYMSNDLGKTWVLLKEALRGSNYEEIADQATWAVHAISKFPDWSKVLMLTPDHGMLAGGGNETQTVGVTVNGTRIPNGTYRTRIHFKTNESEPNNLTVSPAIVVSGQAPDVTYNKIVQFGNILVGQKKTVTINLVNKGYGSFAGGAAFPGIYSDKISTTNPNFRGPEYVQSGLPARSTTAVELTFAPIEAGSHSGQVILTDKDGRQVRINVQGAATEPARMTIDPPTIEVGDLDADNTEGKQVEFTIANEGKYPLQFVMPKYTDETLEEVAHSDTHRFGYVWQSNLYGSTAVAYPGAPQLLDAIDVSKDFGDYTYFSRPIDIGFEFPFYGKKYERLYVSSLGLLTFGTYDEGSIYSPVTEVNTAYLYGLGVISCYGFQCEFDRNSAVLCGHSDGKFVVYFKDVLVSVYDKRFTPASFHIALSPNGDIEMAFDSHTAADVFQQGSSLWVGIVDPEMTDPLTVTSANHTTHAFWYDDESEENNRWRHLNSGTAFEFKAPRPDMITAIQPASGIVPAGESIKVTATVAPSGMMYAGPTQTNLVILSNDLVNPTTILPFNANIIGNLQPIFDLGAESVDFGQVFRTSTPHATLAVQNHGRAPMEIQSVKLEGNTFATDFKEPVTVNAGQSKDILISMATDTQGRYTDKLTIVTSAGERTVDVSGTVIGVPTLDLGYDKLTETLESGITKSVPLSITNNGNETLAYSVTVGNHLAYSPLYSDNASTTYSYVSSVDDPTALRDWVDIETTGLGTQYSYTYFLTKDHINLELPFEFPYYGKKYSKMTIVDSGFITFNEHNDDARWPEPPIDFPFDSDYNNVIAPYWGLHTMDLTSTAGIFYYLADDQVVVSFVEYGNSMNIGVDFQVILRPDGSFTFNYKPAFDYAMIFSPFGYSGINNADGSEGICLPSRLLVLGSSVNFSPVVENTLEPGASAQADITLAADQLAGKYTSSIHIASNVPGKESVEIPVNLTITGNAAPVFPSDIDIEQVAMHRSGKSDELTTLTGAMWYIPFEVANEGTAAFTVTGISVTGSKYEGEDIFTLYYYGKFIDAWTDQETFGWTPYTGSSFEVGRSPVRFAIPFSYNDNSYVAWQTPGTYTLRIAFTLRGVAGMSRKVVNVTIRITEQPNITLDRDEIRIENVADDFTGTERFVITNPVGGANLNYTLRVDATGIGEQAPVYDDVEPMAVKAPGMQLVDVPDMPLVDLPKARMSGKQPKTHELGTSTNIYDNPSPEQMTYNRSLYWPALSTSTAAYNYGTTTTYGTYKAATRYTGPKGGFNISHIYTMYHPFHLDNTDIVVEIYNGNPQTSDDVLGRGTYHLGEITTVLYENVVSCIPLDRPVFISEGQDFYVVVNYPVGQEYPAGLVVKEETYVSDRYLGYWDDFGWFDVAALFYDKYGSLGYVATCLETVEGDAWVKILTPDGEVSSTASGIVEPDSQATIELQLNAANTPKEVDNKAVIVVKSNDPKASVINLPVYLSRNAKPTLTPSIRNVAVDEASTASVTITVVEPDGDDFTLLLTDNGAVGTITAIEPITTASNIAIDEGGLTATVVGATEGVNVTVTLAPDFGDAGNYAFTLSATDTGRHEGFTTVSYSVAHVNRAPEAVEHPTISIPVGQSSEPIDLTALFTDPDGDELTYEAERESGLQRVELYRSGNKLIINSIRSGVSYVNVTATDTAGASVTNRLRIDSSADGIEALIIEGLDVRPNPVVETLYVSTPEATGSVTYKMFAASGALVLADTAQATSAPHALSVGHLPSGVYVLSITTSQATANIFIIKE